MIQSKDIDAVMGADVVDSADERIGKVSQVYVDSHDQHPSWVAVKTGFFGSAETLVPIEDAKWDSSRLHVGVSKATVRDAPHVDPDREITVDEQNRFYRHYGIGAQVPLNGVPSNGVPSDGAPLDGAPSDGAASDGAASDGSVPSDAMVDDATPARASAPVTEDDQDAEYHGAEQVADDGAPVQAATGQHASPARSTGAPHLVPAGQPVSAADAAPPGYRVRLRKVVVTEQRTITVPVSHEEIRLERVPDGEPDGPDVIQGETDVVLMAERPVVTTEQVPVERVHVAVDPVTADERSGS